MNSVTIGDRFKVSKTRHGYNYNIVCRCKCGNVFMTSFKSDTAHRSCGCAKNIYKHKLWNTPVYYTWAAMIQRCCYKNASNYSNYGGSGITVCSRWLLLINFYEDMGHPPSGRTLDRIDNSKGYFKENCRWATKLEQADNRRTTVFITIDGVTRSISDWSREDGASSRSTITRKLKSGITDYKKIVFGRTKERYLTIGGETKSIKNWSKTEGALNYQTIFSRLKIGMSAEEAVFGKKLRNRIAND